MVRRITMRLLLCFLLVLPTVFSCRNRPPANAHKYLSTNDIMRAYGKIEVTCTPQYYRRAGDDALISVENASSQNDDFNATGIVLRIETPQSQAGKILSFHFDFPEKWNHWYRPGRSYVGFIKTNTIGAMSFLCDPGLREITSSRTTDAR